MLIGFNIDTPDVISYADSIFDTSVLGRICREILHIIVYSKLNLYKKKGSSLTYFPEPTSSDTWMFSGVKSTLKEYSH